MVSQIYFRLILLPRSSSAVDETTKLKIINQLQLQNGLDGINDLVLVGLGSSNDTLVDSQGPALAEIQAVAVDVSHLATSLANNQITSSVIPDLLLVVLLDGETQVDVTGTTGNGAVLGLRVQSHAGGGDTKKLSNGGVIALSGVSSLNAFTEDGVGDLGDGTHGDGLAGSKSTTGQRTAGGTLTEDSGEQDTVSSSRGLLGTGAGINGGGIIDGEVRSTNSTDLDVTVNHQTETHGVLAATEEALGAVDGIEGPDTALGTTGAVAVVNDVQHALLTGERATQDIIALRIIQLDVLDQAPDLSAEVLVLTQGAGLLLGDDLVVGEVLADGGDDQGLSAEVANGDGGLVILGDCALGLLEEDLLCEETRPLDGQFGDVTFLLVRHNCRLVGGELGEEEGKTRAGFQSHADD